MRGTVVQTGNGRSVWQPGARPRPELVESILACHGRGQGRALAPTLWGVVLGALIGLSMKASGLEQVLAQGRVEATELMLPHWVLLGLGAAFLHAVGAALLAGKYPKFLQFSSIQLLTLALVVAI